MEKNQVDPPYLTQSKLTAMLSKYFEVSTEVKVGDTRLRSDIQFTHDNIKYAVEFDGDSHYCNSDVIENDIRKNNLLKSSGFNLVRIPYWLQLNDYVFDSCFGFSYPETIPQTYPHGFIDKKAKTPAFYCVKGLLRFNSELDACVKSDKMIFFDIIKSMTNHSKYSNIDDIVPCYVTLPHIFELLEKYTNEDDEYELSICDGFLEFSQK